MDSLIHHLEGGQELSTREIEVAAEFLLDPSASAEKKAHLLEALACAGLSDHIGDGLDIARETIRDGSALEKLRLLQKHSQSIHKA